MKIEFLEKEPDWKNGATRYWFNVDGEEYCICESADNLQLLDGEGYPIEPCNDHGNILAALIPEYKKQIRN